MRTNHAWRLASRPKGAFDPSNFTWAEEAVPALQEGEALVRVTHLSLDPTNRGWAGSDTYMPAVAIGDVMRGIAVGIVEESRDASLQPGDLVSGLLGWQRYAVVPAGSVHRLPPVPGASPTAYLGVLGHIGLTAWVGLLDIGQPRAGETLVVTAAAGAVGSLVGQLGKIRGCRVVGIAGSDDKCAWLTRDLGFDAAINYKTTDVGEALEAHCPTGIDIDFENVGGRIFDAILGHINLHARIVLCGLIAHYTATRPQPGPYNIGRILVQRARMEGFIVLDHAARGADAYPQLWTWVQEGRLTFREEIVKGLDQAPVQVNRLFDGSHTGKLIIEL
jgi:NADPH-dependent curcumin reductase